MTHNEDIINKLYEKLEILLERQDDFSREIKKLQDEIGQLNLSEVEKTPLVPEEKKYRTLSSAEFKEQRAKVLSEVKAQPKQSTPKAANPLVAEEHRAPESKMNLEKFIGENLINKIGIAITVIGVAIGAKYSIEHDLISPLTRIILGYLVAIGLLGFGIKLKEKYESYSAVLVSGAIAIMYFLTYFAHSFYDLIPQVFTFVLMVVFTAFTVVAAIHYNRQVMAHIGLVGAYAVPFLLSNGSGAVAVLFSYMAIINMGILVLAFKKYWKPLYYASFVLTWVIYFSWFAADYKVAEHFALAMTFLVLFFATFYLTFMAYKLLRKEKFDVTDILLLLGNSFIFFGIGYAILNSHTIGASLLGLFAVCNALIHSGVSVLIYKQKLGDKNLFYLVTGLVLVFVSIAIPIQLDGNWVTLLWVGEALLLFWIGRSKKVSIYEQLAYPLMILAFFSLMQDWSLGYNTYVSSDSESRLIPIFNIHFLSSALFVTCFAFIYRIHQNKSYSSAIATYKAMSKIVSISIPAVLIFTLFYAFRMEIANYWNQLFSDSVLSVTGEESEYPEVFKNYDLNRFKSIWIINYSLLFVSLLSFANIRKIKSEQLGLINLGLNAFMVTGFLLVGLFALSELRESYLEQTLAQYYSRGVSYIIIRYISMAFVALSLLATYSYLKQDFIRQNLSMYFDLLLYSSVLWMASSELIHWMDMAESTQSYKLGLSILWGVYSLALIVLGLWQKKKHLRIGAISLFGITLVKLFFYDISHLNTISKTIVFVSLGILLLIISFLYNKYKYIISDEAKS